MQNTTRFFIGNLPANCEDAELKAIFQKYGQVQLLEIKKKPNQDNAIGFVTLQLEHATAQQQLLNAGCQLRGCKLQVSVAKESFLERLKRERAENAAGNAVSENTNVHATSELLSGHQQNKRKKFSVADDEVADEADSDEEHVLITKKRAANSLSHNGKIVIEKFEGSPLHVIEKPKKANKLGKHDLDAKCSNAEQKRRESQLKKSQQYEQKKSAIQNALTNLHEQQAKKIKFSDAESTDDEQPQKHKLKLFEANDDDDDDEETENALNLKPEHFGKKGAKLLAMQSKQQVADARFKIDAKFVDDEDDVDSDDNDEIETNTKQEELNERDWQMSILQQVVKGTVIAPEQHKNSKSNKKKMQRFDPAKEEHVKFLRQEQQVDDKQEQQQQQQQKKKNKNKKSAEDNNNAAPAEVSKDIFYSINEKLIQTLGSTKDNAGTASFSLLKMFGNQSEQHLEAREQQMKELTNEKIIINKLQTKALNPFKYDSSSESETEQTNAANKTVNKKKEKQKQNNSQMMMETFFMAKNDARLKEGATFFVYDKPISADSNENYENVRNRLKMLIRTKIVKSKKNMLASGKKQRRRTAHKIV